MSENNLFQFAQVIAELPIQNTTQNNSHQHQTPPNYNSRYVNIRKNACVVCCVCFTCSKYFGVDCTCQEVQPRRGKNLPEGGLDSRAKKLHREDQDDFEFSIEWINENAHHLYKDENNTVLGLRDLSEVSLCKAHSSTLYRAKKRHERSRGLFHNPTGSPSPVDTTPDHNNNNNNNSHYNMNNPYPMSHSSISSGGLAAKVREISSNQQYHQPQILRMHDVPDFTRMSHSTSVKRKRTFNKPLHKSPKIEQHQRPSSSISTPLFASSSRINTHQFMHNNNPPPPPPPLFGSSVSTNLPMSQEFQQHVQQQQQQQQQMQHQQQMQQKQQQQQIIDNFPSQLPPLHSRGQSISSLPSVPKKQQQPHLTQMQLYHHHPPPPHHNTTTNKETNSRKLENSTPSSPESSTSTAMDITPHTIPMVIETVSLRPSSSESMYYFRNLAITDNFTFRDLLTEIDMTGSPPPGKRIVVSDKEKFYPLDQAIRSVIRRPKSTHLELCLGLTEKPSINWNTYS